MSVTITNGNAIQVGISAGIGPTVVVNGTSTSIVGTAGVNPFVAGANITITTTGGGITVIGRDPPVYSVNGKSGTVVLSVVDITAAAASHTHLTSEISSFSAAAASFAPVQSVAGRAGAVSLTTADVSGLTAAIQTFAKVASVQGKTGTVTLSVSDITAAAASHTHSTTDVSGLTAAIQTHSKVASVQGKSGTVTLTVSDLTAAAFSHTHTTTDITGFASALGSVLPAQSGQTGKYLKTVDGSPVWDVPYSVVTAVLQSGSNITLTPNSEAGTIQIAAQSGGGITVYTYDSEFGVALSDGSGKYKIVQSIPSSTTGNAWLPPLYEVSSGGELHVVNASGANTTLEVYDAENYSVVASLAGGQWAIFVADKTEVNSWQWRVVARGSTSA